MTSKSGYEIRLDVLKLAKEMLELDYKAKEVEYLTQMGNLQTTNIAACASLAAPATPTTDDVIAKASALYNFVNETRGISANNDTRQVLVENRNRSYRK